MHFDLAGRLYGNISHGPCPCVTLSSSLTFKILFFFFTCVVTFQVPGQATGCWRDQTSAAPARCQSEDDGGTEGYDLDSSWPVVTTTAHITQHSTHCTRHTAHGTRHPAHGTPHTAHCTLHIGPPHQNVCSEDTHAIDPLSLFPSEMHPGSVLCRHSCQLAPFFHILTSAELNVDDVVY